jgi:fucose 4-O-acetylase-like acetyltransferase
MKQRIEFIDALKGFTIFCVLWGHSIQDSGNGDDSFFHNQVFEFIYSFHMPLFFMISGFFFNSSLKLNFKELVCKKGLALLLPCLTWTIIFGGLFCTKAFVLKSGINYISELTKIIDPLNWQFWFLKELFISYVLVYIALKIFKKQWLACILSICFVLIAPSCNMQRFLLPLFWLGIYLKNNYQVVLKYSKWILGISGLVFGICLLFWDGNYTIYVSRFPPLIHFIAFSFDFSNLDIALFRLIIGAAGSIFWFVLLQQAYKKNQFFAQLEKAGACTLGIYILQTTVLELIVSSRVNLSTVNIWIYSLIITPLIALFTLIICIYLTKLINKNDFIKTILLGK